MNNKLAEIKIGAYYPATGEREERIERAGSGQGIIFKDGKAFQSGTGVCYVPELSDATYTHQDLLKLCQNNEDITTELFLTLDWQHPETLIEDWYINGELCDCSACGKMIEVNYDDIAFCQHCSVLHEIW